jgi:hypothetical protein
METYLMRFTSLLHRRTRLTLEPLEDRTLLSAPTLGYSATIGQQVGYAVAVDSSGEAFVAGTTSWGGGNAYVAKLNTAGSAFSYFTSLGPAGGEGGIALDSAGDAYVTGWTSSTSFPTTSNAAFTASTAFPGGNTQAGFITELSPTGAILYSTYLPGPDLGWINSPGGAIALDSAGHIYVTGAAGPGLPATASAFQGTYIGSSGTGNSEAFLAVLDPSQSGPAAVLYASYLGGSTGDAGTGISVDASGNAYLVGATSSTNFPTTAGAFQRTYGGGVLDAFVARFNPSLAGAASLIYSTYLGGSGWDGWKSDNPAAINVQESGPGIAIDGAGNAYVTGTTSSTNFPTTPGAFQTSYGHHSSTNSGDAFVTKLNATGSALVYSTYLGGSNLDGGSSIVVDGGGNAHVTGWTQSTNFPTLNPIQASKSSGTDPWGYPNSDVFVTTLNASGSALLFSTYYGGSGDDYGFGITLDSAGNTYVAGQTQSNPFPTTAGALHLSSATYNTFAFKIDPPATLAAAALQSPSNQTDTTTTPAPADPSTLAGGHRRRLVALDALFADAASPA